ncbi:MAG: putative lipoprotein [Halocynthiibacter sp.]|jgi:predicted lipoprotein
MVSVASLAQPAQADVKEVLDRALLPSFATFAQATDALDFVAQNDCTAASLHGAFQAAYDAWMPLATLRIGPSEIGALSISFWPDTRAAIPKTLAKLIADQDPIVEDQAAYAHISIAARGLTALEFMLYDQSLSTYDAQSYACALTRAITRDLAIQAKTLQSAWQNDFAQTLLSAGAQGNATYLDKSEAQRALFTQILAGLEFSVDARLARPMGSFERPRPKRAESWRAGRSVRNIELALNGAQAQAAALATGYLPPDLPQTSAAFDIAYQALAKLQDPAFQDIEMPDARFRAEVLQQALRALQLALANEIGVGLGIVAGFNALDGD